MVQNQMTPSYPPFSQPAAGIEDYQQAGAIPITTQATAAIPTATQLPTVTDPQQFKDTQTVVATTNGVEQQTVSSLCHL